MIGAVLGTSPSCWPCFSGVRHSELAAHYRQREPLICINKSARVNEWNNARLVGNGEVIQTASKKNFGWVREFSVAHWLSTRETAFASI
jgi:hypothetical protein